MSERSKNISVGLTVIAGMAMLGFLILLFTGLPEILQRGYEMKIQMDATYEIHEGDPLFLRGMRVGRVVKVQFTDEDPARGITLTVRIDRKIRVPSNVVPTIFTKGMMGAPYLMLSIEGPKRKDASGRELDFLSTDEVITLRAVHKGSSLIPEELTTGLRSLSKLAESMSSMFEADAAPAPSSRGAATSQDAPATSAPVLPPTPGGLKGTIARLNRALDDVHVVLGDTQNQANVKLTLDNFAKLTARSIEMVQGIQTALNEANKNFGAMTRTVSQTGQDVGELTKKLMTDAEKISELLASMNRVIVKMDQGEGTAGKLLNDPKLYNSLVEASDQLRKLMEEFRQLAEEWKKSGMTLKLK